MSAGFEPGVADGDENVVARRQPASGRSSSATTSLPPAPVKTIARMLRARAYATRSRRGRYGRPRQGFAPVRTRHISEVHVLAAVCARISKDEPLTGLELREIPEPVAADGLGGRRGSRRGAEPARHLEPARRRRDGGEPAGRPRHRRRGRDRRRARGRRARRARERRTGGGRDAGGRLPPLLRAGRAGNARAARRRAVAEPRPQAGASSRSPRPPACRPPTSPPTACSSAAPTCSRASPCSCREPAAASRPRRSSSAARRASRCT